jgi:sugar-phosphatase
VSALPPVPQRLARITALVFDCDGVLVDSQASVERAWRRWALVFNLDPDRVAETAHGQPARATVVAYLGPAEADVALARISDHELGDARSVRAIPGAAELLAALPPDRWAIVTSASRSLASARLAAARLPAPRILVTADDVDRGKPAPDGYRMAIRRLGVAAPQVAVFEDHVNGVRAAREAEAGIVVRVGPEGLPDGEDVTVPDLRGVSWDGRLVIAGWRARPSSHR